MGKLDKYTPAMEFVLYITIGRLVRYVLNNSIAIKPTPVVYNRAFKLTSLSWYIAKTTPVKNRAKQIKRKYLYIVLSFRKYLVDTQYEVVNENQKNQFFNWYIFTTKPQTYHIRLISSEYFPVYSDDVYEK